MNYFSAQIQSIQHPPYHNQQHSLHASPNHLHNVRLQQPLVLPSYTTIASSDESNAIPVSCDHQLQQYGTPVFVNPNLDKFGVHNSYSSSSSSSSSSVLNSSSVGASNRFVRCPPVVNSNVIANRVPLSYDGGVGGGTMLSNPNANQLLIPSQLRMTISSGPYNETVVNAQPNRIGNTLPNQHQAQVSITKSGGTKTCNSRSSTPGSAYISSQSNQSLSNMNCRTQNVNTMMSTSLPSSSSFPFAHPQVYNTNNSNGNIMNNMNMPQYVAQSMNSQAAMYSVPNYALSAQSGQSPNFQPIANSGQFQQSMTRMNANANQMVRDNSMNMHSVLVPQQQQQQPPSQHHQMNSSTGSTVTNFPMFVGSANSGPSSNFIAPNIRPSTTVFGHQVSNATSFCISMSNNRVVNTQNPNLSAEFDNTHLPSMMMTVPVSSPLPGNLITNPVHSEPMNMGNMSGAPAPPSYHNRNLVHHHHHHHQQQQQQQQVAFMAPCRSMGPISMTSGGLAPSSSMNAPSSSTMPIHMTNLHYSSDMVMTNNGLLATGNDRLRMMGMCLENQVHHGLATNSVNPIYNNNNNICLDGASNSFGTIGTGKQSNAKNTTRPKRVRSNKTGTGRTNRANSKKANALASSSSNHGETFGCSIASMTTTNMTSPNYLVNKLSCSTNSKYKTSTSNWNTTCSGPIYSNFNPNMVSHVHNSVDPLASSGGGVNAMKMTTTMTIATGLDPCITSSVSVMAPYLDGPNCFSNDNPMLSQSQYTMQSARHSLSSNQPYALSTESHLPKSTYTNRGNAQPGSCLPSNAALDPTVGQNNVMVSGQVQSDGAHKQAYSQPGGLNNSTCNYENSTHQTSVASSPAVRMQNYLALPQANNVAEPIANANYGRSPKSQSSLSLGPGSYPNSSGTPQSAVDSSLMNFTGDTDRLVCPITNGMVWGPVHIQLNEFAHQYFPDGIHTRRFDFDLTANHLNTIVGRSDLDIVISSHLIHEPMQVCHWATDGLQIRFNDCLLRLDRSVIIDGGAQPAHKVVCVKHLCRPGRNQLEISIADIGQDPNSMSTMAKRRSIINALENHRFVAFMAHMPALNVLLDGLRRRRPAGVNALCDILESLKNSTEECTNNTSPTVAELTLVCPVFKSRIRIPGRITGCQHVEAFDMEAFLRREVLWPRLSCPICGHKSLAGLDGLCIDITILNALHLIHPMIDSILVRSDGYWRLVPPLCLDLSDAASQWQPMIGPLTESVTQAFYQLNSKLEHIRVHHLNNNNNNLPQSSSLIGCEPRSKPMSHCSSPYKSEESCNHRAQPHHKANPSLDTENFASPVCNANSNVCTTSTGKNQSADAAGCDELTNVHWKNLQTSCSKDSFDFNQTTVHSHTFPNNNNNNRNVDFSQAPSCCAQDGINGKSTIVMNNFSPSSNNDGRRLSNGRDLQSADAALFHDTKDNVTNDPIYSSSSDANARVGPCTELSGFSSRPCIDTDNANINTVIPVIPGVNMCTSNSPLTDNTSSKLATLKKDDNGQENIDSVVNKGCSHSAKLTVDSDVLHTAIDISTEHSPNCPIGEKCSISTTTPTPTTTNINTTSSLNKGLDFLLTSNNQSDNLDVDDDSSPQLSSSVLSAAVQSLLTSTNPNSDEDYLPPADNGLTTKDDGKGTMEVGGDHNASLSNFQEKVDGATYKKSFSHCNQFADQQPTSSNDCEQNYVNNAENKADYYQHTSANGALNCDSLFVSSNKRIKLEPSEESSHHYHCSYKEYDNNNNNHHHHHVFDGINREDKNLTYGKLEIKSETNDYDYQGCRSKPKDDDETCKLFAGQIDSKMSYDDLIMDQEDERKESDTNKKNGTVFLKDLTRFPVNDELLRSISSKIEHLDLFLDESYIRFVQHFPCV